VVPWAVLATVGIIAALVAVAVGLGVVDARRTRRLDALPYRCLGCGAEFERPAHHPYPDACPRCGARDWATSPRR